MKKPQLQYLITSKLKNVYSETPGYGLGSVVVNKTYDGDIKKLNKDQYNTIYNTVLLVPINEKYLLLIRNTPKGINYNKEIYIYNKEIMKNSHQEKN